MEEQGSGEVSGSSADLSSAVESIKETAPKLSGLEKLKEQKSYVEKNDAVPPKSGAGEVKKEDQGAVQLPAKGAGVPSTDSAPKDAYVPNFKYKAGNKEFEIPEKFRALITDKDSEEEVKKVFGQAATLDEFKEKTNTLQKNLGEVGNALNQYQSGVQQLRTLAQKNDWDTWFQKLNINPEKIYQWVLDKVQYNQLPPEQRAQIDAQRNLQLQRDQAQEQVSQVSSREMQLATQVKGMQLEQTLGKADVKAMADAFDARNGVGSFRNAIIEHGKSVWALSNNTVDLTPEQAVEDFVKKYGMTSLLAAQNPAAGAATPSPTAQAGNNPALSANATPPVKVIPNVAGRSTSPVKQKPKSIEDLKRLRDQAVKEDNASRSASQGYLAG